MVCTLQNCVDIFCVQKFVTKACTLCRDEVVHSASDLRLSARKVPGYLLFLTALSGASSFSTPALTHRSACRGTQTTGSLLKR